MLNISICDVCNRILITLICCIWLSFGNCELRMGAQLLWKNRQNQLRSQWRQQQTFSNISQRFYVCRCCSAIYSTMWQTTIQADLRCVCTVQCARCVLCAVFVVRKCIRFAKHIEKQLRDVVHIASTIATVNVRIVQLLHLSK